MFRVQTLVCSSTLMSLRTKLMKLLHFFCPFADIRFKTCKRVERESTQRSLFAGDKGAVRKRTQKSLF